MNGTYINLKYITILEWCNSIEFGRILENDLRSDTTRKFEGLLTTQCTHSRQDPDPKEYYFDYEKALEEGRIISGVRMLHPQN